MNQLIIQFGKSKSPSYPAVVKWCCKFDSFSQFETNILAITSFNDICRFIYPLGEIIKTASKWKTFKMTFGNTDVNSPIPFYNQLLDVVHCYFASMRSENHRFCSTYDKSENWGCRQLRIIGKEPWDYVVKWWYDYGAFTGDGKYEIDKYELLEQLQIEATESLCINCPKFNLDIINVRVSELPDEIDLSDTENWEVDFRPFFVGQKQVMLPVGLKHRERFKQFISSVNVGDKYLENLNNFIDNEPEMPNGLLTDDEIANQMIDEYLNKKNDASKDSIA